MKMELKSISISGMHKVAAATYDLSHMTYFVGPNGAGKSTILEAIQLALLGYIPGYAKTNEAVMKHAQGDTLSVSLVIQAGESDVTIQRSWVRRGSTVQSNSTAIPETFDIKAILDQVELPVFNFNDFLGLTANKMKEWFINFLPNDSQSIEWKTALNDALGDRVVCSQEAFDDVMDFISESSETGVNLVQAVNSHIKESLSFEKGQLSRLQGTVQTLVFYDDAIADTVESVNAALAEVDSELSRLASVNASRAAHRGILDKIQQIHVPAPCAEEDSHLGMLIKEAIDLSDEVEQDKKLLDAKKDEFQQLSKQINDLASIKSSVCPYTHQVCKDIEDKIASNEQEANELRTKLSKLQADIDAAETQYKLKYARCAAVVGERDTLQGMYKRLAEYKSMLPSDLDQNELAEISTDDLVARRSVLVDKLAKVKANEQFSAINDQITQEKFKVEQTVECLKIWDKLTGANGLQTTVMQAPFESLTNDMTQYLQQFMDPDSICRFNLESKANSFSFGVDRRGKYIPFEVLSAGERCLYTLALLVCLLKRSNCAIQLVMLDDLVDHLDDEHSEKLFQTLASIPDIQFIVAGVKNCNDESIQHRLS